MRKPTVSKSIRLTSEYVDLIEREPGKNFTDKLQSVLDEYFFGATKRKDEIARYEKYIYQANKKLDYYYNLEKDLANIRRNAIQAESSMSKLLQSIRLNDDT